MIRLLHDPSVCVFMYGQATESRWVTCLEYMCLLQLYQQMKYIMI